MAHPLTHMDEEQKLWLEWSIEDDFLMWLGSLSEEDFETLMNDRADGYRQEN